MTHKRRKSCGLCGVKYEYLWEDSEAWVERILCRICYEAQGLGNYSPEVAQRKPA